MSSLKATSSSMQSSVDFGIRRCISPLFALLMVMFTGALLYNAAGPGAIPNLSLSITWNDPKDMTNDHVEEVSQISADKLRSSFSPQPQVVTTPSPAWKPKFDQPVNHFSAPSPPLSGPVSWPPEVLMVSENERLQKVLQAASMYDRTVIVATLNAAWSVPGSMFDLYLESFRIGNETQQLLNNLVIFNLDPQAYAKCKSVHPHCFALITDGIDFSSDQFFMSPGYLDLVWKKLDLLRMVLQQGYNFIFSDLDVMWFRNPIQHFNPDADFQSSCDHFNGNPTDLENFPNTGFMYVRANKRTSAFFNYWYESRLKYPGNGQQGVFKAIKYDQFISDLGIKFWFLSTEYFGGICEPARDLGKVCTMHATCCVGIEQKVHDLRILLDDWKKYLHLIPRIRAIRQYTWSFLQLRCSS